LLKAPHLVLANDLVCAALHQDAPAFTARLVKAVSLETDLRMDGTTFPLQVSLSLVHTMTGQLTLAVIRDLTHPQPRADLAALARAIAAGQETSGRELLDRVTSGLYHVGLSLLEAESFRQEQAVRRIEAALRELDDLIRETRDCVFTNHAGPPGTHHR
jgi:hypothetical protein